MTPEVRNQLQAEDQNFMWLEGSDLSLSLAEWMSPNSRIPIRLYLSNHKELKKPRWGENDIQSYFVGGGPPGLVVSS